MNVVHRCGAGQFLAVFAAVTAALVSASAGAADPPPRYVTADASGALVYQAEARGDRVPDFSHCGYHGGGVVLPEVPVRVVVPPAAGDNGAAIQAAIAYLEQLPGDARGMRGAVLLLAGRHELAGRITIKTGGIVLRGQGDGPGGTVLVATGTDRRPLIRIEGRPDRTGAEAGSGAEPESRISDEYVPVGAHRVRLDRAGSLRAGDRVVVHHESTAAWIASLGMDRFPPGDEGGWLRWLPGTLDIGFERVITGIEGTTLTLDAPLTTAFDAALGGGTVRRLGASGRIAEVGVENLRCESAFDPANPKNEQHAWDAVSLVGAENAWVRRVTAAHFAGSAVRVGEGCKWVTVEDCTSLEPVSEIGGYRRQTFFTSGQMTLFLRCRAEQGIHDFATGALAAGPNAFVSCAAVTALGFSGPVESWSSGVLYDNVTVDGAGLSLTNRETDGQGIGWAAANCVLWQCAASVVTCRNPPGARNWAIGCWGQFLGDGHWQMPNEFVKPDSLYRAQLAERLGPDALASLKPGTIDSGRGDAPLVAGLVPTKPIAAVAASDSSRTETRLALRDGWLVAGDTLLRGARVGTVWWRGHLLPARAPGYGIGVTRFVPGLDGPGYTDDLDALTDAMRAAGQVALEHHWGLWYDRRRDDHEMVRRIDGSVWAPFYEHPWARSGRGLAWDGLSKYDLTAFNPWYFARLDEFAGLGDRKALVLLHEAYFQHNILEAGAHWADFPWRPANCLQATGFPEPPPYANGKRIFMADAFYDVTHPVRRALHQQYIRKCLDTLGGHPNVVFLTGEEYTGPLAFMQFWIDTVTAWERETGRNVLIGLSATKDVQDAILEDPARGPTVGVIDLKYWWYTADGTLYAPEGGKNLAPRQQWREWKGARKRSDAETARQIREYRNRYPDKAILWSGGAANPWTVLAAGGSLPALPGTTDLRLLAALPRMRPTGAGGSATVLADPGREYLVVAPAPAPGGGPARFAIPSGGGPFEVRPIDPASGRAGRLPGLWPAGKILDVPASASGPGPAVLWLTRAAVGDEGRTGDSSP